MLFARELSGNLFKPSSTYCFACLGLNCEKMTCSFRSNTCACSIISWMCICPNSCARSASHVLLTYVISVINTLAWRQSSDSAIALTVVSPVTRFRRCELHHQVRHRSSEDAQAPSNPLRDIPVLAFSCGVSQRSLVKERDDALGTI